MSSSRLAARTWVPRAHIRVYNGTVGQTLGVFFATAFILLALAGSVFWIWMIIDCATNEPNTGNDKVVWIIIIIFTQIIGALIYYFVRRRPRRFAEWQRSTFGPQRQ